MEAAGASGMLDPDNDQELGNLVQSFRGQFASKIGGGTDDIQHNIVGERVLGLPDDIRVDKNLPFRELIS